MNKEEFRAVIGKIQIAYNKTFSRDEMVMWFKEFQNIPKEKFEKAIDKHIKENKFFPRIADIRKNLCYDRQRENKSRD